MQQQWLIRENNNDCLLFLSGWGMDSRPFKAIPGGGLDVLMLYDYRDLAPFSLELLAGYAQVHLLAWSMGVWVAGHLFSANKDKFAQRIALAGTLTPVHKEQGIPPESYKAIESNISPAALDDFYQSMFTESEQAEQFLALRPSRNLDELHAELHNFRTTALQFGPSEDIFTTKIVTSRDRVFPLRNQLRAWGKADCTVLKLPHFPFYSFADWKTLLT